MSPNPDACEEELAFREGQLIKVRGDKDADGFYWGEIGGRCGYAPCNMVSEVQVDDERVAQELLKVQFGLIFQYSRKLLILMKLSRNLLQMHRVIQEYVGIFELKVKDKDVTDGGIFMQICQLKG